MKHFLVLATLSISVLLGSCSTGPQEITYPSYGHIKLEDSTGTPIPPPYTGITVTIPETNTSVTTDSLGHWTIASLPLNNYHIIISKEGFGSISFLENTSVIDSVGWFPPGFVVLTQAPASIVHIEKVFCWDSSGTYFPAGVMPAVTAKSSRVFIFIDTIPNIPSTGVHLSNPSEIYGHLGNDWVANDQTDIGYLGIRHGQTIYITACAAYDGVRFLDSNNHEVLGNVGPSSNAYPIVFP